MVDPLGDGTEELGCSGAAVSQAWHECGKRFSYLNLLGWRYRTMGNRSRRRPSPIGPVNP